MTTPEDLVALMAAARDASTAPGERELLAAIARTPLLVATGIDPETGRPAITLSLDPSGAPVAVGFTSVEELRRWAGDTALDLGRVSGRDLARVALAGHAMALFIDPASDHGGRLAADRLDVLASDGSLTFEAEDAPGVLRLRTGGEPLTVAPPARGAHCGLVDVMRPALARSAGVVAAMLLEIVDPVRGSAAGRHPLLVLVLEEPGQGLPPAVERALAAGAGEGRYVDVYPVAREQWERGDFDGARMGLQVWPVPATDADGLG